ncbi:putative ribonuclease H protein [Corchorus capsularis]|uniref:Putative ribonuclease H protein n=1 Tax=Corchorus capsularis TaxID=210143 RepID=A0A1R3JG87_COCAP|nr:putative ribonuclease H protein [Corchorus capsularis]
MEDSLSAPTSKEGTPRSFRKFKRTRTDSADQEEMIETCEDGMVDGESHLPSQNTSYKDRLIGVKLSEKQTWPDWDVDDDDGDVCFADVASDSEEPVISGARASFSEEEKREISPEESFGPWKLVQRKTRRPVRDQTSNVNTYGASSGNPGPFGAGGIKRDDQGRILTAFSRKLGCTTSVLA